MTAYYNENDPWAAQLLRNLIDAGHICPGDVDERSIEDVQPNDIKGYVQCHFFAGAGVWSYSLRQAGWSDDRHVWTGSCPCQPFSTAGKGGGFDDERHLWPAFHHLIAQCRPSVVFGEQVASKDGLTWIDLVQADMEGSYYAFGALDLCAAGFGAPHIRQRLYWMGDHHHQGPQGHCRDGDDSHQSGWIDPMQDRSIGTAGAIDELADTTRGGSGTGLRDSGSPDEWRGQLTDIGAICTLADTNGGDASTERQQRSREQRLFAQDSSAITLADTGNGQLSQPGWGSQRRDGYGSNGAHLATGPTNGHWRAADWLLCRDGKWRPVEPGTFPLAHGAPAKVGRLRAYGNALVAAQATEFIAASMWQIDGLPVRLSRDALQQNQTRLRT